MMVKNEKNKQLLSIGTVGWSLGVDFMCADIKVEATVDVEMFANNGLTQHKEQGLYTGSH